jgi:hypothetical protein
VLPLGERTQLGLEPFDRAKPKTAAAGESFAREITALEDIAELLHAAAETAGVERAGDRFLAHRVIINAVSCAFP